ncbi:MAG: hypothetical protein EOO61_10380 [Hymenobacter sp.]|nr:MAG: hypothetical protein EOO61_10380 [Hymenobacter sp.]
MTKLTATVNIPLDTHKRAVSASGDCKLKIGEYTAACVDYFAQRGLNPVLESTRQTEILVSEIRKLGNRIFGFLQEQERGVMTPLLQELVRSRFLQEETLDFALQTMVKVYGDEKFLEIGRENARKRVQERTESALSALSDTAPGKVKNKPKE